MGKRFEYAYGIWYIIDGVVKNSMAILITYKKALSFMEINYNSDETYQSQKNKIKILVVFFIIALGAWLRFSGLANKIDLETIRSFIQGFGYIGPLIYILIVTIAPALMLPGAPFIIAGGILFGSFWGVVYGITGATTGACLAFLVSRYLLREWVESKLTSHRWVKLKNQTEKHGWKIVAITRLVPLVPFNLLSYALGLTRIKFSHYVITSFICMLPGCIAYILLSSSILDLIKGEVTPELIAGVIIILILSLLPIYFKKRY